MSINLFDVDYYRISNPDLASAGLTTNAQLSSHFQAYGLNEGRSFSPVVDLSFYRDNNLDLAAAGLTTNKQVLDHLQNYGVAEGRQFSPFVDLNFYLQDYPDLTAAFKGNREQALQHLDMFGLQEGRQFSPYVDLNFYLNNNPDVNKAVAGSGLGALKHLEQFGLKEGRLFSPFVDLNLYRAANPDLKSFNNSQSLQHLEANGIREGRVFSHAFDLNYYLSNNPDLLTSYAAGKNIRTDAVVASPQQFSSFRNFAYNHFIINGINEGRRSSEAFDVNFYKAENTDLANFNNLQLYQHFRSFGLKELRPLSDAYDATFYSKNNSATANLNQQQLYEYYITGGNQNDVATQNPVFRNEVLSSLDLTSGKAVAQGTLSSDSQPNPSRLGSYSEDYQLDGVDVGQKVQINLTAKYDTILQLINHKTGEIITQNDNISASNLNSQINFTVQPNTKYVVRATSVDAKNFGDFTLTSTAASTAVGLIMASNGNKSDTLSNTDLPNPDLPGTFRRDYSLDLTGVTAGQVVQVDLNSSNFYPLLQLVNADTKELIDESDSGGTQTPTLHNSELLFKVVNGVNYILRTSSFTQGGTGNFALTTKVTGASIKGNQALTGIVSGNNVDTFTLDTTGINSGDKIRLNLNSVLSNTTLEVDGSDGSKNTDISEIPVTVNTSTTYTIKVSHLPSYNIGKYTLTTTLLSGANGSVTLNDQNLENLLGNKTTLSRVDVLNFFNSATAGNTVSTTQQADLKTLADNAVRFEMPNSLSFLLKKVVEALPLTTQAPTQTLQDAVNRWFLGKTPPNNVFVDEDKPKEPVVTTYQPIQGNLYGTDSEAKIRGINQGSLGDCAFLAALGATFATPEYEGNQNTSSSIINQMIQDNGGGIFTFRFFKDGKASYVTVDSQVSTIQLSSGTPQLVFAARGGVGGNKALNDPQSSIWVPLIERAYAQFREGVDGGNGYDLIGNGDSVKNPLSYVTGRQADDFVNENGVFVDQNHPTQNFVTFDDIANDLNQGRAIEVGSFGEKKLQSDFIEAGHAYAVTKAYLNPTDQQQHVVVYNPWGQDSNKKPSGQPDDGFIDLTYQDFLKDFGEMAIA